MSVSVIVTIFVVLAASSGALFKPGDWYESLSKPAWTPPNWAFPVVWTILYLMIAVAGWLIITRQGWGMVALVWVVQLVLNAAWSGFFFGAKRMDLAFANVCLLWVSIVILIVAAWSIAPTASFLLVPYLAWVTTAAALNWQVMKMNSDAV